MKTLYDTYLKINKESETYELNILKFYFKNSIAYSSHKITKCKSGVNVKCKITGKKFYAEFDKYTDIILKYPDYNSMCIGEILFYDFVKTIKHHDELIKG